MFAKHSDFLSLCHTINKRKWKILKIKSKLKLSIIILHFHKNHENRNILLFIYC